MKINPTSGMEKDEIKFWQLQSKKQPLISIAFFLKKGHIKLSQYLRALVG